MDRLLDMTMNKTMPASKTQHMLVTNNTLSTASWKLVITSTSAVWSPATCFSVTFYSLLGLTSSWLSLFSLSFVLPPSVLKTSAFRAPNSFCRPPPTRCSTVSPSFWAEARPSRPRPLWVGRAPLWAPLSPHCPPPSQASAVEESWWPCETLRSTVTITYTINISSVRRRRPPHPQPCPVPLTWVTTFTRRSSLTPPARTRSMKTLCGVWWSWVQCELF